MLFFSKQKSLEEQNGMLQEQVSKIESLSDIVEVLQRFSKIGTSCNQLAKLGHNVSDYYYLDYDGLGEGKPPFRAFCQFPEEIVKLGNEITFDVEHCDGNFCYEHPLTNEIPDEQLTKLIEASSTCYQTISLQCYSSPIKVIKKIYLSKVQIHG